MGHIVLYIVTGWVAANVALVALALRLRPRPPDPYLLYRPERSPVVAAAERIVAARYRALAGLYDTPASGERP